jgi:hypothetical protein
VFPAPGRWRLTLVVGKRSFAFPAVLAGGKVAPQDYVSFPRGSMAARQGGGGVYMTDDSAASGEGTSLPPEVISIADEADDGDGGGIATGAWLFPLLGVVIAGAGVATYRRRR